MFGMAGRAAAELAKALQLIDRHLGIARQIEQRIKQHRAMTGREHETVAVGPLGMGGIEFEKALEQHRRRDRHAHGHPGMPRRRLLHGIHGQRTDGIGEVALGSIGGGGLVHVGAS